MYRAVPYTMIVRVHVLIDLQPCAAACRTRRRQGPTRSSLGPYAGLRFDR